MQATIRSLALLICGLIGFACGIGAFATASALAQEPLFLRIRPTGETSVGLGGTGSSAEDIARDARARSEAVWRRAEARSRIAIASVCTGCIPVARAVDPGSNPVPPAARDLTPMTAVLPADSLPPLAQADAP